MNEWVEQHGKEHDRKVIDLMLAHVPGGKVESVYNRAAYMPRRREIARIWADKLTEGLPPPAELVGRVARESKLGQQRKPLPTVPASFRFPVPQGNSSLR